MDNKSDDTAPEDFSSEEETDYLDYELVQLDEDVKDLFSIRRLSDTTEDKLIFTIMLTDALVTCFLAGYVPNYFYLWHTFKYIILMSFRVYTYKKLRWHYFLIDFCYFTNNLVLLYVWSPWKLGWLFPVIYVFSMGPLMFGIVVYRNSLVPHSMDKMTSLFIHTSPLIVVWGLKWHSTVEQGFELCGNATSVGIDGCDHVGWKELLLLPLAVYFVWLTIYAFILFGWRAKRIKERDYLTAFSYMAEQKKKTIMYRFCNYYGPKYRRHMFLLQQTIYTVLSLLSTYFAYFSMTYAVFIILMTCVIGSYNGASFYIDVLGHRHLNGNTRTKSS